MRRVVLAVLLCLLSALLSTPSLARQAPAAVDGVLDLRQWDFRNDGPVTVSGSLPFWWGRLLDPRAVAAAGPPDAVVGLPHYWDGSPEVVARPLDRRCGTYRLRVLLSPDAPALLLQSGRVGTVRTFFANGAHLMGPRQTGCADGTLPDTGSEAPLQAGITEVDLLIHVSATLTYGGLATPISLYDARTLQDEQRLETLLFTAVASISITLGLMLLALYQLWRHDMALLWLGISSVAYPLYRLMGESGLNLWMAAIGIPPYFFPVLLMSVGTFGYITCQYLFNAALFHGIAGRGWVRLVLANWALFCLSTPLGVYFNELFLVALSVHSVAQSWLLVSAIRQGRPLAWPALGFATVLLAGMGLAAATSSMVMLDVAFMSIMTWQVLILVLRARQAHRMMEATQARLAELNRNLECQVSDRTRHLTEAMETLKSAQDRLVRSEKLAGLGQLVAGVAHEVNTPIGVSLTAITHLAGETRQLAGRYRSGRLTESDFTDYLETVEEGTRLVECNIRRAADLVQSFKKVAVDQSSAERRQFNLREYLDEILVSLNPALKRTPHRVVLDGGQDIVMDSYPGPFAQVMTNLVMNSLSHAFAEGRPGAITITADRVGSAAVRVVYRDNGRGIPADILPKVFDPFFTTKRSSGGSGLGLHIVHNTVCGPLGGSVDLHSEPDGGVVFTLILPLSAPPQMQRPPAPPLPVPT